MLSYGADPKVTFVRKTKKVAYERSQSLWGNYAVYRYSTPQSDYFAYDYYNRTNEELYYYETALLVFAEKLYPFVLVQKQTEKEGRVDVIEKHIFYHIDPLEDFLKEIDHHNKHVIEGFKKFFEHVKTGYQTERKFSPEAFDAPYLVWRQNGITHCPPLTEYQFQKIKPPQEAFQEIEQHLGKEVGIPETYVENSSLIKKKGFDDRTSFKTTSPGKKRKRRKKG